MALIVYSSIKGGCGKTTLAAHHAVWLHDQGYRVALIDADSLKLSSQWIKKVETEIETHHATEPKQISDLVRRLSKSHDMTIADCPGAAGLQTISLLKRADLALLPILASPLDLLASLQGAITLVRQIRKSNKGKPDARLLVNGVDRRRNKVQKQIRTILAQLGIPALKTFVSRLAPLNDAFAEDSVVTRMGWKGIRPSRELKTLFREVQAIVEPNTKRRVANG